MLSRTAEGLFWMARYIERAENIARLLEAGRRFETAPVVGLEDGNEWPAILIAAGCQETFPGEIEEADAAAAIHHMTVDPENPSTIKACFAMARANGRAQRVAITTEVWAAINDAWRATRDLTEADFAPRKLADKLEEARNMTAQLRGAVEGTQLRNEGYRFIRLGQLIERADATARLLDLKYHVLLPDDRQVGDGFDELQWTHLLRAAGGHAAYRAVYRSKVTALNVVDYLILNPQCPRSLRHCYDEIGEQIARLVPEDAPHPPSLGDAMATRKLLQSRTPKSIIVDGLHQYLTQMIVQTNTLAVSVADDFGFGPASQTQSQSQG